MHGIIFTELRKYVDEQLGATAWGGLLASAGLKGRMYLPIREYPDAEAIALVGAAADVTGLEVPAILEDFGRFIAPSLLGMYRTIVKPEWRTLDVIENTEDTIHTVVRARNPGAKPAKLKAVRLSATELQLIYSSDRKLCPVARGIMKGVAACFDEEISVEETKCMHDGADHCEMTVVLLPAKKSGRKATAKAPKAKAPKPAATKGAKQTRTKAGSKTAKKKVGAKAKVA
ncbi:MAG: heme NO-binding domain-containing protein [Gemmatimonadota bacterium]